MRQGFPLLPGVLTALSLAVCLYVYAGYPLLLVVVSRLRPRPLRRAPVWPRTTVIVPAHNEAAVIHGKILNTLALDYPPELIEVIVASDGSTDGTADLARAIDDRRVHVLDLPRRGKAFALNAAVREARGEVLVFSDANIDLAPDSVARLVEGFADPEVGGVCGNKMVVTRDRTGAVTRGEGLYWRFDKWQKELEGIIGSVVSSDGALHAVRRELHVPIVDPAVADDFAISVRVPLGGHRLTFERRALAFEDAPDDPAHELRRKIRVANASLRALLDLRGKLWSSGWYSLQLVSHKLLRYLVPLFLIIALAASLAAAPTHPAFAGLAALQLLLYALAGAGHLLRRSRAGRCRPLAVPYYFCLVNLAALGGIVSLLRGTRYGIWLPRTGAHT